MKINMNITVNTNLFGCRGTFSFTNKIWGPLFPDHSSRISKRCCRRSTYDMQFNNDDKEIQTKYIHKYSTTCRYLPLLYQSWIDLQFHDQWSPIHAICLVRQLSAYNHQCSLNTVGTNTYKTLQSLKSHSTSPL